MCSVASYHRHEKEKQIFMKIACLLMQKNEGPLLDVWISYHANIFGAENIFIYDNGSTDIVTKEVLRAALRSGVNVDWDNNTKKHFEEKGRIITAKIQGLDSFGAYDFFFPLDCDEFVAAELCDGGLSVELAMIESSLEPYLNSPHVLMICSEYNNNPMALDYYRRRDVQRKCFFARGACASLDMGYHNGRAKKSELEVKPPIVYMHFHNKTYSNYQRSAREKMVGRVENFSEKILKDHLAQRKIGSHVIPALLQSKHEYESGFDTHEHVYFPDLRLATSDLGGSIFFKEFGLDSARGFVESAVKTRNGIELRGWVVNDSGGQVESLKILVCGVPVTKIKIEHVLRVDVFEAGIANFKTCGFHAVIDEELCEIFKVMVLAVIGGKDRLVRYL